MTTGADSFQQLACLNYSHSDSPANWERARKMLEADPAIASADICSACCVGDVGVVKHFLDQDVSLANQQGGHFDWQPLMYACYSRLNLPDKSTLEVARLLLERGADPNAFFMWGGQYKFTALTGVFGEGEGGPTNLPEHAECETLARLLLDAGANPNDAQALYNRMFTRGSRCLELLLEYGLNDKDRCNWLLCSENGLQPNPEQTLHYQLRWAINNHHPERAKLLIDHGADMSTAEGATSLYESAMLAGNPQLAEYLVEHGAEHVALNSLAKFACACMRGDRAEAQLLFDAEPDLMARLQDERAGLIHDAASANRLEAVRVMADLGADLDRQTHNAPMHEAAWHGHVEMVRLLIEKGATIGARDQSHTATPLQWARHAGNQHVVDYLATCEGV